MTIVSEQLVNYTDLTADAQKQARQDFVNYYVREFKNDKFGTAPYTFLGTVNYVKHEGSRPISFTFKLDSPIPAKYLKKTNKLVIG